jgi:Flp pilus assembly protein TadB
MSKERARRRAERTAVLEKEKAARARRVARRQRRRQMVKRLTPRARRTGRLHRRSRGERIGIVLVPLVLAAAVWLLVPELSLRIVLTTLLVLSAPALVVVILGRKAG